MNIPNSIEKLTETNSGDVFNRPQPVPSLNSTVIADIIKQNLNTPGNKAFDYGAAFYKISNSEKQLLKNLIALYSEIFAKALQSTDIDDKQKDNIVEFEKSFFKNIEQQIDTFFGLISSVINKKVIDVNEISCSILGYAIETIKRNS